MQFLVTYPRHRTQGDTYGQSDYSSFCNSENEPCSHLEDGRVIKWGLLLLVKMEKQRADLAPALKYMRKQFSRHLPLGINVYWSLRDGKIRGWVRYCLPYYFDRVFRAQWRKRKAVRSWQTSCTEQIKLKLWEHWGTAHSTRRWELPRGRTPGIFREFLLVISWVLMKIQRWANVAL